MATSHPYISGSGNIAQMIEHLRKSFPQKISSDTVKKLGLASNNESYVINALQFIKLINEEGAKTELAGKVFSHHKDEEFSSAFSELVKNAYSGLFELYNDGAWALETDDLITFFRQSDQTSDAIGKRQAGVFKMFAGISGHLTTPALRNNTSSVGKSTKTITKKVVSPKLKSKSVTPLATPVNIHRPSNSSGRDFGLSVRVEINLPANGSKETYDNIFKSIKENLIDG